MSNGNDERDSKFVEAAQANRPTVTLEPDLVERCEEWAALSMAEHTSGELIHDMPFSSDQLTPAEFAEWVASREEAGSKIDIETCEIDRWPTYEADPYGFRESRGELPKEMMQTGKSRFVRSPKSRGWVCEDDLPREKRLAMYDRMNCEAVAYDVMEERLKDAAKAFDAADWRTSWQVHDIIKQVIRAFAVGRGVLDVRTIAHLMYSALKAGIERGNPAGQSFMHGGDQGSQHG
jgi:hypothetical protein